MERGAVAAGLLLLAFSCGVDSTRAVQPVRDRVQDLRASIAALIDGRDAALRTASPAERHDLEQLYHGNHDGAVWLDAAGRSTPNLRAALTLLDQADEDALDPVEYYREALARLVPAADAESATTQELAELDVVLSAGVLRYLRDVHLGRIDPRTLGLDLRTPGDQCDFAALLRASLANQHVADLALGLRPQLEQYRLLQAELSRYRVIATAQTPPVPVPTTRAVHPGERYAGVAALRQTLAALGDLPETAPVTSPIDRYDGAIVEGVKAFQTRHGLEPDGVLGRRTIAALRVPATWRLRQIEFALERLRWVPHLSGERLIALNIPMFHLWAWDLVPSSGVPRLGMDVIVGKALRTQTPVFVEEIREITFRPYWNVPRSILLHEVLPRIDRDPDYLRREDMEIVRGAGDDAARVDVSADSLARLRRGALRLRQRPGPRNALGLIKFAFTNRDDVCMHGTPAQELFAKNRRDFSHGCVRVADPAALAEWALQGQPQWTRAHIEAATAGSRTIHVPLTRPIEVVLLYTTAAVVPEDAAIHFAEDIYGHDLELDRALAENKRSR